MAPLKNPESNMKVVEKTKLALVDVASVFLLSFQIFSQ